MAQQNKDKVARIHEQMPRLFNTKTNPNWKALIGAIGESDNNVTALIEEVKKQLFISTAVRPYIDRLGANFQVQRPKSIGMDDDTYRQYIPILAYQPKQVKHILDLLLDLFFFKETTTAFNQTIATSPYSLVDGWELTYVVDAYKQENIIFHASDFININAATAEEISSVINRQSQHSFSVVYNDRINKKTLIRIFSNTLGSKGSVQITGGRADIVLQFSGFNIISGSQANTQWNVTKIGNTMTFTYVGGNNPNLSKVNIGDVAIISIVGNEGSFVIENVDLSNNSFSFENIFGTAGSYDHSILLATELVRFMTPEKMVVFTNDSRSLVWEVSPGEIIVEIPATPPIVKRSLKGSAHFNGVVSAVTDTPSSSSLILDDASIWPNSGQFILQPKEEILTHILTISEDVTLSKQFNTRYNTEQRYSFTGKSGNTLTGITPNIPTLSSLYEFNISSAIRDAFSTVTVTTTAPHGFLVGEGVSVTNTSPDIGLNGTFVIKSVPSVTTFQYISTGAAGSTTGGTARTERIGMAAAGSFAYLTSAQINTGILGPYMWDSAAAFVLSSLTSTIQNDINAGNILRTLQINPTNNIPDVEGFVIFDFGTDFQEGPVRYLYKPTSSSMQMDPAYVFQYNHLAGSAVTVIRQKGAHVMSGIASEYPAYITDPSVARATLENLMLQVKSSGIFIDFLVRYPKNIYSTLDLYNSGNPNLWPIT